jgi:hypothetical protein
MADVPKLVDGLDEEAGIVPPVPELPAVPAAAAPAAIPSTAATPAVSAVAAAPIIADAVEPTSPLTIRFAMNGMTAMASE